VHQQIIAQQVLIQKKLDFKLKINANHARQDIIVYMASMIFLILVMPDIIVCLDLILQLLILILIMELDNLVLLVIIVLKLLSCLHLVLMVKLEFRQEGKLLMTALNVKLGIIVSLMTLFPKIARQELIVLKGRVLLHCVLKDITQLQLRQLVNQSVQYVLQGIFVIRQE